MKERKEEEREQNVEGEIRKGKNREKMQKGESNDRFKIKRKKSDMIKTRTRN